MVELELEALVTICSLSYLPCQASLVLIIVALSPNPSAAVKLLQVWAIL